MRDPEAAFAWVEALLDGRIVMRQEHARWRPQWFLDLETSAGVTPLLLRGYRNPGRLDDEAGSGARLRQEAGILSALQSTGVKVPRYYGYAPTGDWFLMERVAGEELISKVTRKRRQRRIFGQYIRKLLRDELEMCFAPAASGNLSYLLRVVAAQAEACRLAGSIGPAITLANVDELCALLSQKVESEVDGLRLLQQRLAADPERDLGRWLAALYRIECRREYVLEPIIRPANHSPFEPFVRLDGR